MQTNELRELYQQFFEERGHKRIHSAPLLPENDPTVLFTTAGMQPLVPYLLGEPHPLGHRLVDVQKVLRTDDIEQVGDVAHLTFFEMLGNWSLGDYFKQESLTWSYEFLTQVLRLDPQRLAVTVFGGDADAPRDDESAAIWRQLGIPQERIYFLPKKDNWWGPVGATGPSGPDSEIFYDTGRPNHPGCSCGKWFEVWNNVFMEYEKTSDGRYVKLKQRNVDTGLGLERTVAMLNGYDDVFLVDSLLPLIQRIESLSGRSYAGNPKAFRVIADHLRAATFAIADGANPSNIEAGYVVRRLIRRAIRYGRELGITDTFCVALSAVVLEMFGSVYPELEQSYDRIAKELEREEVKFKGTLERGLREYHKVIERVGASGGATVPGEEAFNLFETFGFPLPLTVELAHEQGLTVDETGFDALYQEHWQISRRGMGAKFKGGLADHAEATTQLHTATHLLHQALRQVLGPTVRQMSSNITAERLRFDFSYPEKLTPESIKSVEGIVNQQIANDLPVSVQVMTLDQAVASGALAFFGDKYGEQVKVYMIGTFSKEVCGGPHVKRTNELPQFKITKQESVGQGVRRIRAVLGEPPN